MLNIDASIVEGVNTELIVKMLLKSTDITNYIEMELFLIQKMMLNCHYDFYFIKMTESIKTKELDFIKIVSNSFSLEKNIDNYSVDQDNISLFSFIHYDINNTLSIEFSL